MTRFVALALFCGMVLGMFTMAAFVNVKADPVPTVEPAAPKVAYVDFRELLRKYGPLQRAQFEIAQDLEMILQGVDGRYADQIAAHEATLRNYEPDHRNYRVADRALIQLERSILQEKLLAEQQAQADLRDAGIEAFSRLRSLVTDVARQRGYSQVLNILRDPQTAATAQPDFQMLQQQLLVSPVLVFDSAHDLTDEVLARGDELWGTHISFRNEKIHCTLDGESLDVNEEGEYEVRLGQTVVFSVEVLQRDELLDPGHPDAGVRWFREGGLDGGSLDRLTGEYSAPSDNPGRHTFRVLVRSQLDPTVSAEVTVRLLNADGSPLADPAEAEAEAEDAEDTEAQED
jgi:Skp family chaperone for outer membrane proteins